MTSSLRPVLASRLAEPGTALQPQPFGVASARLNDQLLGVCFLLVVCVCLIITPLDGCLTFSTLSSLRPLQGRDCLTKQCISFWLRSVYKLLCKLDVGFF